MTPRAAAIASGLPHGHRIAGVRVQGTGAEHPVMDPGHGETIGGIRFATASEVDDAVDSSSRALRGDWSRASPVQRSRLLMAASRALQHRADTFARVESLNVGKPLRQALADVATAVRFLEYYAGVADKLQGESIPMGPGMAVWTEREPAGVTAHIVPWNAPLAMLVRGVAPALAAGCTAVVKPAEATPYTALMFADLLHEVGLPPGVLNVICGEGRDAGAALALHPRVNHITFTGSVAVGKTVMAAASSHLATVTLELGGKSPLAVMNDADLDAAVQGILRGIFTNAGQICAASSRLIVQEGVHDALMERLVDATSRLSLGHGLDDPDVGPLISAVQLDRVDAAVSAAGRDGVVLGGRRAEVAGHRGYFFEPTIVAADPDDALAQAEIFGPVLAVMKARDIDEAISIANNTRYGLVAGIYTRDIDAAFRFSRAVEASQVFVNRYLAGGVETPVGGMKDSGFGREKGLQGLDAYLRTKCATVSFSVG